MCFMMIPMYISIYITSDIVNCDESCYIAVVVRLSSFVVISVQVGRESVG